MHGILSYEERVRLERANGIRPKNEQGLAGWKGNEDHLKGLTYEDVGNMPQPLRAVCPHPKVIVPTVPALRVKENVKELTPEFGEAKWRVADFRSTDARNQGLTAIPNGATVGLSETVVTATTAVVDTAFDHPHEVKVIKSDIKADGNAVQPMTTGATVAEPIMGTEDGKELVRVDVLDQEIND